jgi:hypothetical protein
MIPMGYMAKRVVAPPGFLSAVKGIVDVYSVSDCVNDNFADFVDDWRHNGYWFFDHPGIIANLAREKAIDLAGTLLFYYEAYDQEYTGADWRDFGPWKRHPGVDVKPLAAKTLEGFDVVTFWSENSSQPEHSPLSCNSLAEEIPTNEHCLLRSLEEAKRALERGKFAEGEAGPCWRVFAVYSVDEAWPPITEQFV